MIYRRWDIVEEYMFRFAEENDVLQVSKTIIFLTDNHLFLNF